MAARVSGPFEAETQIVSLRHEGSTTWVQCQLGFVGDLCSYQKTPFEKFCDYGFLINREHDLSFMGRCMPRVWVGRSKLIWVVNLRIVYGYVMSK